SEKSGWPLPLLSYPGATVLQVPLPVVSVATTVVPSSRSICAPSVLVATRSKVSFPFPVFVSTWAYVALPGLNTAPVLSGVRVAVAESRDRIRHGAGVRRPAEPPDHRPVGHGAVGRGAPRRLCSARSPRIRGDVPLAVRRRRLDAGADRVGVGTPTHIALRCVR